MSGSKMLARRASSEALLMTIAPAAARSLLFKKVSCAVFPWLVKRYWVGTLSEGQASVISNDRLVGHALPRVSLPRGGITIFPSATPRLAAANQFWALHQLTCPKTSPCVPCEKC